MTPRGLKEMAAAAGSPQEGQLCLEFQLDKLIVGLALSGHLCPTPTSAAPALSAFEVNGQAAARLLRLCL